ncbi:MAG: outer membrane beta-barrel protein [Bacteroidetes bacterium]|nr:outer membrane beta-barrel protein [Bacteroidota bacterium]
MKKTLIIALLLGTFQFAEAQCFFKGFGIEAGYSRSTITANPMKFSHLLPKPTLNSFSFSVYKTQNISNHLSLIYRAGYIRQGYESSENIRYDWEGAYFGNNVYGMRSHRLSLDFNVRYSFTKGKIRPYIGFGARTLATLKTKIDDPYKNIYDPEGQVPNIHSSNFRKLDIALLPAIGLELGKQFRLESSWNFGLIKAVYFNGLQPYYNRSFTVSLGYTFQRPKAHRKYNKMINPAF